MTFHKPRTQRKIFHIKPELMQKAFHKPLVLSTACDVHLAKLNTLHRCGISEDTLRDLRIKKICNNFGLVFLRMCGFKRWKLDFVQSQSNYKYQVKVNPPSILINIWWT